MSIPPPAACPSPTRSPLCTHSFPPVQTNRGFSANVILLDEAAFADEALLLQSLFPTLMMARMVMLMITTPTGLESLFMRLVNGTDEQGRALMPVIWLGQPCETCMASSNRLACQHVWYQAPWWKDPQRYERLKHLWKFAEEINARENFGLASQHGRIGFTNDMISGLFDSEPLMDMQYRPSVVYVTADAAAGGESDFALSAAYFSGEFMVVRRGAAI